MRIPYALQCSIIAMLLLQVNHLSSQEYHKICKGENYIQLESNDKYLVELELENYMKGSSEQGLVCQLVGSAKTERIEFSGAKSKQYVILDNDGGKLELQVEGESNYYDYCIKTTSYQIPQGFDKSQENNICEGNGIHFVVDVSNSQSDKDLVQISKLLNQLQSEHIDLGIRLTLFGGTSISKNGQGAIASLAEMAKQVERKSTSWSAGIEKIEVGQIEHLIFISDAFSNVGTSKSEEFEQLHAIQEQQEEKGLSFEFFLYGELGKSESVKIYFQSEGGDLSNYLKGISKSLASCKKERSKESIFQVYPNPTSSSITFELKQGVISEVEIIDSYGKRQLIETVNTIKGELNISELPAGQYIIKATSKEGKQETQKLIKIK